MNRAPSTVSFYLSQLASNNIVESKIIDSKKYYYIIDSLSLQMIINEYHPDLLDKTADRFGDTFSSL